VRQLQTVFYSWQADLPNRTNRTFIEDALERAVKSLRADDSLKVELRVDRDTADVAGSPAIADTILQKIANAEIFVPDVSIVARTENGKACPNPNVLLELGYAVSRLGWDRIIMVMNTAFGAISELPFDLRGRRVMSYVVQPASGAPKGEERRNLEENLTNAMAAILGEQRTRADVGRKEQRRSLVEWARNFKDQRINKISSREGTAANLTSDKLVCIHLVPAGAISGETVLAINELDPQTTYLPPFGSTGFNTDFNGDGLLRVDSDQNRLNSYLQVFRNGIIESVNSQMLTGRGMREDGLPSQAFCMSLGAFLSKAVELFQVLNIGPPACVLLTMIGLKGAPLFLAANSGYYSRPFDRDVIALPEVVIEDFTNDPKPLLRPALDVLWQHAGEDSCPYFLADGTWNLRTF
jgi:predicted nucleotide-binding protein with TIR-like domain